MSGTPGEALHAEGGEVGALIAARDWSGTRLGPIEGWPQSLRIALRILLGSRYAMWLGWGQDLAFFYNDSYARMTLGDKHPSALGRPVSEVWAEIWKDVGPRADQVLRTGVATWDEGLLLFLERKGGQREETYHTFSYSPVPDDAAGGAIAGLLCVVTEETDRVIGERRLLTLRELAADLAASRSEAEVAAAIGGRLAESKDLPFTLTYLLEADGARARLLSASGLEAGTLAAPRVLELALGAPGWPAHEVASRGALVEVDDLAARFPGLPTGAWDRPPARAVLTPLAQQGHARPAGFLVAGLSPYRPFDAASRGFVELLAGQIAAAVASTRAYQEERRRAEALAELDRAKTAFFSNVSHELRTPLTLLLGPLEELLADGALAPARERLSLMHRNGHRLLALVNNLLDFARIEAGRAQASFEPTDLASLTADLASVFRSAVERAGLRLVIRCEPVGEPVHVDRAMWEKIVLNLVSNAFKYTLEGELEVSLRAREGEVELAVRDTGIGVPEEELPKLWTRFHRVEGAQGRTHEGSGIGLALVHELVKLHGGRVAVTSQLGRGSTFTVVLPLGVAHLPAEQRVAGSGAGAPSRARSFVEEALRWLPDGDGSHSPELEPARAGAPGGRPRVLVADDNPDMRGYVARLLAVEHEVVTVGDGQEALERARAAPPDLVLTDVMMPRLDGFGLLRALREDPRTSTIPIIMLSARAGEEARVEGLGAGADDYLTKPFSARELLARVGGALALARFRREALAREAELRAETTYVLESITEGFLALDPEFRITYLNAEAERINGVPRSELLGRSQWEAFPASLGTRIEAEYRRAMTERRPAKFEHHYEPTGRWFELDVYPASQGGLAIYFRDVTERKRRTEELEDARAEAEAANRMKDQFLATLSHELRTPLNAILGWARILRSGRADGKTLAEGLETIERNSKVQAQLIEDLLDLSRIISGKLRLDVQTVNLVEVIEAATASVRPAAEAKALRVRTVLDSLAGPVNGDPARLQQMVWNLLSNAVKFTPKGGQVQVVLERVSSHIEITVADTGIGIEPAFLPHVFERFRQADASTTRLQGGLGLGLSIVRQLVELHGGTVRAKSPGLGQGSTFTLSLPISVAQQRERAPSARPADADVPALRAAALAGLRVLVVDDEPDARELVRRILTDASAEVTAAASVESALAEVERRAPDLLVSDIGMPERDGYDLIARLRERGLHGRALPAVALTAFARPEDRRRALLAGFQTHVPKPVDPAELVAVVATLAGRTGGPSP